MWVVGIFSLRMLRPKFQNKKSEIRQVIVRNLFGIFGGGVGPVLKTQTQTNRSGTLIQT